MSNSLMCSTDKFVDVLIKTLGCPKHTNKIVLTLEAGELCTVECLYYPESECDLFEIKKERFNLVRAKDNWCLP